MLPLRLTGLMRRWKMRDKEGNYLTTKEFLERWKKGIQKVTPLQQTKISLQGVILVLIGVVVGIVSSFMTGIWWLLIILCGSLFLTVINLIGTLQRYYSLKEIEKQFNEVNYIKEGLKMNNKGQAELVGFVFAVIAGVLGFVMAGTMNSGIILKFVVTICCGLAGYFIPVLASK